MEERPKQRAKQLWGWRRGAGGAGLGIPDDGRKVLRGMTSKEVLTSSESRASPF